MTKLPAAHAMATLVEAIHPDALNRVPNAAVRLRVANAGESQPVIGGSATSVVLRVEVGLIARDSAAVRCWRRRRRGCPSPPFPRA